MTSARHHLWTMRERKPVALQAPVAAWVVKLVARLGAVATGAVEQA
jgi:hypothetical protein